MVDKIWRVWEKESGVRERLIEKRRERGGGGDIECDREMGREKEGERERDGALSDWKWARVGRECVRESER